MSDNKSKNYTKPTLKKYGTVKDFTRTLSHGGQADGGAYPADSKHCISSISPMQEHQVLLSDTFCQNAFAKVIQQTVKPGDIVLDLGCGTGVHTLMALGYGAKKVYAIEINPLIEVAREVIADNHCADKVEFIMGDSLNIDLPERVDVIISNLGFLGSLESLTDAYRRFLKPNGTMIPDNCQLHFTPVSEDNFYKKMIQFWDQQHMGFNFSAFRRLAANHPFYFKMQQHKATSLIADFEPIDYKLPKSLYCWEHNFFINKSSTINGWLGWYDFRLNNESFISTNPGSQLHPDLWSHIYLPLEQSLDLAAGDKINFKLTMSNELAPDGPVWRWITTINNKLIFDQSTFKAMPLSEKILAKLN
ncbi:MAG: 50S ribosomal protein L11 methyltransferase [Bdellovibrionales bacterium]|nr:50S ribosomal protein L11 methyltransferase [Bdellovibrionales bacterium]